MEIRQSILTLATSTALCLTLLAVLDKNLEVFPVLPSLPIAD